MTDYMRRSPEMHGLRMGEEIVRANPFMIESAPDAPEESRISGATLAIEQPWKGSPETTKVPITSEE